MATRETWSQVDTIYQALRSGPKSPEELVALGVNPLKLTARMADVRRKLQGLGCDWLHRAGKYELVEPQ